MKKTIFIFLIFFWISGQAQNQQIGQAIKQDIIKVFGGSKALKTVKTFAYTLVKGAPLHPKISERVTMDFQMRTIRKVFKEEGELVTQVYKNDQGWEIKAGERTKLSDKQTQRLTNNFFYNFIGMLLDDRIQWHFIQSTTYKKQKVRIVKVFDKAHSLYLYVNNMGEIVTSTSDHPANRNSYFADELDYQKVTRGSGIRFPLIFRVFHQGECTYEGRFSNVKINE